MAIKQELQALNVDLSCDLQCEGCEKFFDCDRPEKLETYRRGRMETAKQRMAEIKRKIVVLGGKGGVGKTLVAVNLAAALAMKGRKVTVLDQNFDGPCVPKMLGLEGTKLTMTDDGIIPAEAILGIQVVSMGLILDNTEVLTWFHDMRRNATEEFLTHVVYGERDYLITDHPAGTSDDTVNLMQYIPDADGVVVVTIPSDVSQGVAKKAILVARKANLPVLGIMENMSGLVCPKCGSHRDLFQKGGGDSLSRDTGVELMGRIPIDPIISECSDAGEPFVYKHPESKSAKAFLEMVDRIEDLVNWGKD